LQRGEIWGNPPLPHTHPHTHTQTPTHTHTHTHTHTPDVAMKISVTSVGLLSVQNCAWAADLVAPVFCLP